LKEFGTIDSKTSTVAKMLAFVLLLSGTGIAEAENIHFVPLDRSESIHQYSDQFGTVLGVQENDALQVVVFGTDLPPYPRLEVRRAFLEFTIPSLSGMITSTLILQKYYDAGHPPVVPFEVSDYDPQTDITLQTFNIPTTPVTEFSTDYTQRSETVAVDISAAVSQYVGRAMGLRIRVLDEGKLGETIFRGAGFEDDYNGEAPWIEIVEISPVEALEALLTVISDLVDDKNLARSLTHPLTSAIRILGNDNARNDKAAVNMLGAFINKVEAQRGKKISEAAADVLIEEAISLQLFLQP